MKIKISIVLISAAACLLTACTGSPETSQSMTTAVITESPDITEAPEVTQASEPTVEITQAPMITKQPKTEPTSAPTGKPKTTSKPKETDKIVTTAKPSETSKPKSETKLKTSATKKKETAKTKQTTVKKKPDKKKETTTKTKSAYDYPFDVERIKNDMIAKGETMGMKHVTSFGGEAYTPENSSWGITITADKDLQGVKLKNKLMEYVGMYTPKFFKDHGGEPAKEFTIYAEPLSGGSYQFYFLY